MVDDDPNLLELFRESLLDLSFDVSVASNGEEGLELFRQFSFDCVVTDVVMPSMSGVEMVGHLRALNPAIPIYFTTGYLDFSREVLNVFKPKAVIFKPFDVEEAALLIKNHFLKSI